MATTTLTVHLNKPHPKQRQFLRSPAKRIVVRAGRRGGKTVGMAIKAVESFLNGRRVLYAAPTADQINTFWRHVRDALQPCIDAGLYTKNETEKTIELRGTEQRIKAKTAWNSDTLRGDYADLLILDEWQLMNEDAWGVVGAPMLLDNDGDAVFIYTPPSARTAGVSKAHDKKHAAKLFAQAQADVSGRWAAFTFSSHDNPYLSGDALGEISGDMSNLAYRQEIMAEDIDEIPGALWTRATLERSRVKSAPSLYRIVVAVDPEATATATSAETGIIVAGIDENEIGYLLEDCTLRGSPAEWGAAVVRAFDRWQADRIVAETNNGGDMVKFVVEQAARELHRQEERDSEKIPYKQLHASRGKHTRAEPVSTLYENGRCKHVGTYEELEDQLCVAGDTLIATASGNKRIDSIVAGDLVLTRYGYRPVAWAGCTNPSAQVVEILSSCGRYLCTTMSHPVYTMERGFIPVSQLNIGNTLETLQCQIDHYPMASGVQRSHTMDAFIQFKTKADITETQQLASCCTESFGKITRGRFQKDGMFITETATSRTTLLKTLSAYPIPITPSNIFTELRHLKRNGGEKIAPSNGRALPLASIPVMDVDGNLKALAPVQDGAAMSAAASTIVRLRELKKKQPVYNLSVEEHPEYYANGILVHNCTWLPGDKSPDRLDAAVWAFTELMLGRPKREGGSYQG